MDQVIAAFTWLFDPEHFTGSNGIATRLGEHVYYTTLTLVIAVCIALPIGFFIGHTGKGRSFAIPVAGALRALPTLGLLTALALFMGLGILAPLTALVLLAIPPLLAGAYAALEAVDRTTIDAARAIGMTEWQILLKVELPLGLPLIIGGIRSATLQVIATWTVAALLPLGGLGRYILDGIPLRDYAMILAGAMLVIALALVTDGLFAVAQKLVVPRGVNEGRPEDVRVKTVNPQSTVREEEEYVER